MRRFPVAAPLKRRRFLACCGAALAGWAFAPSLCRAAAPAATLLTIPLELQGDWGGTHLPSAERVAQRIRQACLSELRLLSDRQPKRLRVENRRTGLPNIWFHDEPADTAWIVVDIGPNDWSKLAVQLGHEIGHVLCNSWRRDAKPGPPCQWLEEALVNAFSMRGIARLADSWQAAPPFAGNASFASALRGYRRDRLAEFRAGGPPGADRALAGWYRDNRGRLESGAGASTGPAILRLVDAYGEDRTCVADLGALNRWPERTFLPLADYLARWEASCAELGALGHLPRRLRDLLDVT